MRPAAALVTLAVASLSVTGLVVLFQRERVPETRSPSSQEAALQAQLAAKDAEIGALQRRIAELEAAATVLTAREPARSPAASEQGAAQSPREPSATAPDPAQPTATDALAWLRRVLPDRFAATTVAGLHEITELDLRGVAITDADLVHLRALHGLTSLNLRGTQVTDAGLHHLAGLTNLQTLELRGTAVTGATLGALPIGLQHVDLTNTRAGRDVLAGMPALPSLGTLKLNQVPVTDADVDALVRWPRLHHLEIDGTQISEQGLRRILDLHPRIARIEARGTRISPEFQEELQRRFPGLDLVLAQNPLAMQSR